MSFRRRIALLAGVAVAIAILLASSLAYVTIRSELRSQVDASLLARAQQFVDASHRGRGGPGRRPGAHGRPHGPGAPGGPAFRPPPPRRGGVDFYEQLVDPDGTTISIDAGRSLPVDRDTREIAASAGGADADLRDARIDGEEVRLAIFPLPGGGAIQLARPLREVNSALARIRLILLAVALGGIAVAALLGRLVAGRAIEPLRRLTATAEHVAETRDFGRRIDTGPGSDEIGRLATRFNEMLEAVQSSMGALDASVRSQRQLIADASHELRTPVTSLRTNLEVLQGNPDLPAERRAGLLARANEQVEELTSLMNDLIDLARGDQLADGRESVRLDELVEEAIERARRHAPAQAFDADLEECTVSGSSGRLAKALNNLLDNAVEWNAADRPVEVRLRDGVLTVRDHGAGFAPGEIGHAFDRFFRGAHARDRPGSGLGLAIVRQVAESHGGTVEAANAAGGGALMTLRLPVQRPSRGEAAQSNSTQPLWASVSSDEARSPRSDSV